MENKYQISEKGKSFSFKKKNDFIEYCQEKYNESINNKKTPQILFSYDAGDSWHDINSFKILRQTIQNEKSINNTSNSIPNQTKETSSFGWVKNLFFLVLLVLGGYYLFNNKTKSNNSNQQIESNGESNVIDNRMSEEEIEAQLNNIFNSQENSKEDNSPLSTIEKAVRSLNSSEKNYFINILNSNSDPEGKIDMRCGTEVTPCEWCGTSISYYSKWNSRISDMKTITNPWVSMYTSLALVFGGALSGQDPVESVKNDLRENFRLIEAGEVYYCSKSNPPKFCSKNCEYQNSIHR